MRLIFINLLQVLRHLRRHIGQTVLSVAGLVFGLVAFTLSASDLWYRTHYDDFRRDYRQLYCIHTHNMSGGILEDRLSMHVERVADLRQRLPKGTAMTLTHSGNRYHQVGIEGQDDRWTADVVSGREVDSAFASVMDVRTVAGNLDALWKEPDRIAISDSLALQLFGTVQAVGETVRLSRMGGSGDERLVYMVVAVIRKERHTAITFDDFLLPYTLPEVATELQWATQAYVRTDNPEEVGRQLALSDTLYNREHAHRPERLSLAPLRLMPILETNIDLWKAAFYPITFVLLAALLLLSALFNYTALLVSMCQGQLNEYRLRMCLGGGLADNVRRLLLETGLTWACVSLLGAVLLELSVPLFNLEITVDQLYGYYLLFALVLLGLILCFALYPLFRLSRLYRSSLAHRTPKRSLHSAMLVIQMAVSLLLFFLVLNGYRQFRFVTGDGLGFSYDRVLRVHRTSWNPSEEARQLFSDETIAALRQESPAVEDARNFRTNIFQAGMQMSMGASYMREGATGSDVRIVQLPADAPAFFEMDVRGLDGEKRTAPLQEDEALVSSRLVGRFQLTADDNMVFANGNHYRVVGTLDYRTRTFNERLDDIVFIPEGKGQSPSGFYVKYLPGRRDEALAAVQRMAERLHVGEQETTVMDFSDYMIDFYREEQYYLTLFSLLTGIGLCITLFGVLAMVSYELRRSRKAMAVRRVFGAGMRRLLRSYMSVYLLAVAAGAVIALPLGYTLMNWWLQRYDGQIAVGGWPALVVCLVLLVFTAGVVAVCLCRAMRENPAEIIKEE